ncbi:Ubiquitin c-terminal hydrolase [Mycena chlorophos]|uniref:ubiquitinyl hydrolase 1 n=1 Tax=Mycena chlorophos TaxID=658473 RepID=A0A8H6VZ84_MYCCL|nr:Ubiquitin c-terminal hydrolase [Mycena chlorophos]
MEEPEPQNDTVDLVGEPFAVIESDPAVFTSLARRLGIRGVEFVELYSIDAFAVDHLSPLGLVFCFLWKRDSNKPHEFDDPSASRVWFANQLSDDACASQALLNIALNCPNLRIGDGLAMFKHETEHMSPVMKGLAISNSPSIRSAHRALARPSDLRGALNSAATATLEAAKKKPKPPTSKRGTTNKKPAKETKKESEEQEVYHFIGYVPAHGKVWELDGLKSGPLEVGELEEDPHPGHSAKSWMDVARPALRMKMQKYGQGNIRFCLLALVEGAFEKANDALEFLKREKVSIERRLPAEWEALVDMNRLEQSQYAFISPICGGSIAAGTTYASDFGARRMERDMEIMRMQPQELVEAWERCVQDAVRAKVALEDEVSKGYRANTEHIKRTHDYEPFIKEFISCLQTEGLLDPLLNPNDPKSKKRKKDDK